MPERVRFPKERVTLAGLVVVPLRGTVLQTGGVRLPGEGGFEAEVRTDAPARDTSLRFVLGIATNSSESSEIQSNVPGVKGLLVTWIAAEVP